MVETWVPPDCPLLDDWGEDGVRTQDGTALGVRKGDLAVRDNTDGPSGCSVE